MTLSDKVVLIVGIATCITMLIAGWVGEKAFTAIISKMAPVPTPEENKENKVARPVHRKRPIFYALLFIEGIALLLLLWHNHGHAAVTFEMLLQVGIAIFAMVLAVVMYLLSGLLDLMRWQLDLIHEHVLITENLHEEIGDHRGIMKELASEIDKKAYSRKKVSLETAAESDAPRL